jgi:hypothetical protein
MLVLPTTLLAINQNPTVPKPELAIDQSSFEPEQALDPRSVKRI